MKHIAGSSFFIDVQTTDTEASSSTAEGFGLEGGVAGDLLSFSVQATDARVREVHSILAWAEVRVLVSCR